MRRAMCELMYPPNPQKKKKRKHHPAPIVETYPGICYLCAKEEGDWNSSAHRMPPCSIWRRRTHQKRREWFKSMFVPETRGRKATTLHIVAVEQAVRGRCAPMQEAYEAGLTHERSG